MQSINVSCGGLMTLPRNEFTREGYVFFGWATHVDGAAIGTGGETVAMPEVSATGTITLYAIWKLETRLLVPDTTLYLAPASTNFNVPVCADHSTTWTAQTQASWISIDGANVRKGSETIRLLIDANTSADARIGMVMIAGKQCVIAQDGDSSVKIRLDPSEVTLPMRAKGAPFSVVAPQDVSWTAKATYDWLSIESGSSGIGNGTVWCSVASNDRGSTRGGEVMVSQRKENVISDVFRDLLVWIRDRDNVEGNEHRWMSYPLSKTFLMGVRCRTRKITR